MAKRLVSSKPSWTQVKAALATFDRAGLLDLIHDLYAANKENQTFLHTRLGVSPDPLRPYKEQLRRWLWPDVVRNQYPSIAKAKEAIASFKKSSGETTGLAELMVFYCELASGFCSDFGGGQDDFNALVRMFEGALQVCTQLDGPDRDALIARLEQVAETSQIFGYGVGDEMDSLLVLYSSI